MVRPASSIYLPRLRPPAPCTNDSGLTEPVDATVRCYYGRPYRVLDAGRFVTALQRAIGDPQIRRLPLTGAVDQFVDSTDALGDIGFLRSVLAISRQPARPLS